MSVSLTVYCYSTGTLNIFHLDMQALKWLKISSLESTGTVLRWNISVSYFYITYNMMILQY